ncbi:MAG TPA: glucose 1-dehydrogenase [Kribbella sp.]|nr:glucose 1-dehydrogenase [Kribbella sp.]
MEGLFTGICGTDIELVSGAFGSGRPGADHLVIGHESLGRVLEAPEGSGFRAGDLVAGVVRRPDPVPCPACARGEWDFCRNGQYTERGIKEMDGYGAERWRVDPYFAVPVPGELGHLGVLVEPASILTKAWEQVDQVGARSWFGPKYALVTGAGPIGLLAALIATQRGYDVHVLDRTVDGPKPELVRALGGTYLTDLNDLSVEPDVVIEATGAGQVVFDCAKLLAPAGVMCLTGISPGPASIDVQLDALIRQLVVRNVALVGSVNAAKRNYADAVDVLLAADRSWLERLITRTVPLSDWPSALVREPDDIKVVVDLRG